VLVGLPKELVPLLFNCNFILVYFNNTHRMLVGLLQGVGALAVIFNSIQNHSIILIDFHNTHQVLVWLPQGVDGLALI
jgi:hypothetical protein